MHDRPRITVSVIHAEPERAFSVEVSLPQGATVADAIGRSGVRHARPDIEIREDRTSGVYLSRREPSGKFSVNHSRHWAND